MINLSENRTKDILNRIALKLPAFPLSATPPAMGQIIHKIIREQTGNHDPYSRLKKQSNRLALSLYPALKRKVEKATDSLLTAVELAIAGNIIDYGARSDLDLKRELEKIIRAEEQSISRENSVLFNFSGFEKQLGQARTILYLADNAGEIVFDKVLIEEIRTHYHDRAIHVAVRGGPIINDCTLEDGKLCGIDGIAYLLANGSDAPGTILHQCSDEFLEIYRQSDLVISKGQGNFESLSDSNKKIFYLFMVKCPVLSRDLDCKLGDIVLKNNSAAKEQS
jgi:uncharacterized protein with ATP-grasp and redox domains